MVAPILVYLLPWRSAKIRREARVIRDTSHNACMSLYERAKAQVARDGLESLQDSTLKLIWSDKNHFNMFEQRQAHAAHATLVGASDTTAHTLASIFACLCAFPEWQKKLRDDVMAVMRDSEEDLPTMKMASQLPRLDAFFQEVTRLFPMGAFGSLYLS